jgi:hypothetical protein
MTSSVIFSPSLLFSSYPFYLLIRVERCQGTRLLVQGGVASGTIEIIRCSDFKLELVSTVPTISVDETVTLHITAIAPSPAGNQQQTAQQIRANSAASVYTTHSTGVSLRLVEKQLNPDQPQIFDDTATVISSYSVPSDTDVGGEVTQYISQLVGNELRTEMVVREGAGYATTARAKQEADEREERNRTLLEGFLRNAVNTNPPRS